MIFKNLFIYSSCKFWKRSSRNCSVDSSKKHSITVSEEYLKNKFKKFFRNVDVIVLPEAHLRIISETLLRIPLKVYMRIPLKCFFQKCLSKCLRGIFHKFFSLDIIQRSAHKILPRIRPENLLWISLKII